MQEPRLLSIKRCRELLPDSDKLSDEVVVSNRNRMYGLARRLIELYDKLTDFFTRVKTIDARARIVK